MPKLKLTESDGGRPKAVVDKFTWQPKGIVVNVSDALVSIFKEGDVVRLNENMMSPSYQMWENCSKIGDNPYTGLYLVSEHMVIGIELNTEEMNITESPVGSEMIAAAKASFQKHSNDYLNGTLSATPYEEGFKKATEQRISLGDAKG